MVCANDKYAYTNIYMLFISLSYCFHKTNIFSNVIVLDFSTIFQTYDLISCDTSCDHSYVPLHHLRRKINKKIKIKSKIKSKKIIENNKKAK